MGLIDYLKVVRRRWRLIVTVLLFTLLLATVATLLPPRQYGASAQLYVSTVSGENSSDLAQGSTFTQRQVTTYADVVTTPYVLAPVIEELGLDLTPDQLAEQVSAEAPANTVLLDLQVTDPDPDQALAIAEAVADRLVVTLATLDQVTPTPPAP